jgi:hypothetical protein
MTKHYRPWKIDQTQLLPPSVQDYVPEDHLSRFVVALVRESLDLCEIEAAYASGLGQPPFDPQLMTALLLHAYASGIYSLRRISRACEERAGFMMIVAGDPPDFREGRKKNGKSPEPPDEEPDGKAQKNFTDPESRILKSKDGFIQGYNAQVAVDGEAQIIVAHGLTQSSCDHDQLEPPVDGVEANTGRRPDETSADRGYLSEANLAALQARRITDYIATGRAKHPSAGRCRGGPLTQAMRRKLRRAGWRSRYRLRKQIVEPVFGQIKQGRGFRQFLLRGVEAVRAEWALLCIAHNLVKLAKAA